MWGKRHRSLARALILVGLSGAAIPGPARAQLYDWTGPYLGIHAGGGAAISDFSNPYGSSIFGDTVTVPDFKLGAQAGFNYQLPQSALVIGIEGDFDWLDGVRTNTCFAISGTFTSSNCRANLNWESSLTGRVGIATGTMGRTLLYLKGGAAVLNSDHSATTNNFFGLTSFLGVNTADNTTDRRGSDWGWTIGAGVEQAIAPAWSVRLEYDYSDYGRSSIATPVSFVTTTGGVATAIPGTTANIDQTAHQFKLGVNYHIGESAGARWEEAEETLPVGSEFADGWAAEGGLRYWYSTGKFQKDLPVFPSPDTNLISRLTYDDVIGHSGELFGRIDSPFNVFLKGIVGLGVTTGGQMNDEDWGLVTAAPFTAYSNTLSNLSDQDFRYATVDLGFDAFRTQRAKVGPFVGYSYYHIKMEADDCEQLAGASPSSGICSPAITNTKVITETDSWNALRIGGVAEVALTDRLKLVGEAAYLPYVDFNGTDNHWLRNLVIDEDGSGRGVQLEAILSYSVTPRFGLGVGGRFWSMWTDEGSDAFNGVLIDRNDSYSTERYGVFLQGSYKIGGPRG